MSSQKVGTVEDGEGKGSSNEITFSYNLKPFSDEDDMEGLAVTLKTVTFDGLVKWGDHELVKIAFGLKMLKITVTIMIMEPEMGSTQYSQNHLCRLN